MAPPDQPDEPDSGPDGPLTFPCPRCGTETSERLWGPCRACREFLVGSVQGEAHEVAVSRFEPAMHVVPNQVATKD